MLSPLDWLELAQDTLSMPPMELLDMVWDAADQDELPFIPDYPEV